ncbi:MAG TPA: 50S ribosomal protein L35 [Chromatiales bacterium]|nr:50S ribosomal protein L35 [Chromatiales bacterium]
MPKLKTNRGAAKRFRRTATGGYKCAHSHHRHNLTKKNAKRKRTLCATTMLHPSDVPVARRMLPYS